MNLRAWAPTLLGLVSLLALSACSERLDAEPPRALDGPNVMIYSEGVFGDPKITRADQDKHARKLVDAGYTTVIHAFVHVYPDASLVLNDTPIIHANGTPNADLAYLRDIYRQMKADGKVRHILVSIGGGGCASCAHSQTDYNFSRIMSFSRLYPDPAANPFLRNLLALRNFFEIDGIDLDFEPETPGMAEYSDAFGDLLADLTIWAKDRGMMVTAAPYAYGSDGFWKRFLERTRTADGAQRVDWLNIQTYSQTDYAYWMTAMRDANIGVTDKAAFMIPGFACHDPRQVRDGADLQARMVALKSAYPGLDGGFLWQFGDMLPDPPVSACAGTAAEYAGAIVEGVRAQR